MNDHGDDHVNMLLSETHEDDGRWAFGTGFEDPLYGIDTTVAVGTDTAQLAGMCLALGDDALILAQRLAQWCTNAPELEIEVALANIGLDLLGQARLLYARAGQVDGTGRGEDAYAYLRGPADFRNVTLAELPDADFAFTVLRLLVLSSWRLCVFQQLCATASDRVVAAIAAKGVSELTYHRQFAAEWTVRLGDGTDESHRRMRAALNDISPHLPELFDPATDFGPRMPGVEQEVTAVLRQALDAATLPMMTAAQPLLRGRAGQHTPHLAPLLREMQSLARGHPGASW